MRVGQRLVLLASLIASCGAPPDVQPEAGAPDAAPKDAPSGADVVDAAGCKQGDTRCSDSQLGVETCDATGKWSDPVPCASQTCVNGACAGSCSPGQTQCSGNSIQTCDGSGTWAISQTCPVACCDAACIDTNTDANNCGGCGKSCGALSCGKSFTAFTGAQSANWTANGNATYDGANQAAQLTDTGASESGTWVYDHAVLVDDATFQFDYYAGGGSGADGLAFMLETNGPTALGTYGGGLGVAGLAGFGVELDEYDNAECLDDSANHIGIDSLTSCGDGVPTTLVVNDSPGFTIADATWHTVVVQVQNGAFTVTANGVTQFTSYTPTGWANGSYYVGFGAGTGGLANVHSVRNVTVSFAAPHCY